MGRVCYSHPTDRRVCYRHPPDRRVCYRHPPDRRAVLARGSPSAHWCFKKKNGARREFARVPRSEDVLAHSRPPQPQPPESRWRELTRIEVNEAQADSRPVGLLSAAATELVAGCRARTYFFLRPFSSSWGLADGEPLGDAVSTWKANLNDASCPRPFRGCPPDSIQPLGVRHRRAPKKT